MSISKRVVLYSALTPEECASRLKTTIGREPTFSFFHCRSSSVIGWVKGIRFRFRRQTKYRNDFQWHASGVLAPHVNGTRIDGKFGPRPFVGIFMAVWFTGAVVIGGAVFLLTLAHMALGWFKFEGNGPPWLGLVISPAILLAGLTMFRFGRHHEARFLTQFLIETLEGTPEQVT